MMKKSFKKVATIMIAAVLGTMTMGSTVAFAMTRSDTQECKIDSVSASIDIEGGLDPKANDYLAKAFDKMTIYTDDEITRYTVKVKDFKYFGDDAYISKITAKNMIYEGEKYESDFKEKIVNYEVKEKDANGHATSFEISFKNQNEWIVAGFFDIEVSLVNAVEKTSFQIELITSDLGNGNTPENPPAPKDKGTNQQKQNANTNTANNNVNNKTTETATQKPTATPSVKPSQSPTVKPANNKNNDNTPKTGDEMSTGVIIAIAVGGLSVVSLIGALIYKKRKNNL